MKKKITYKAGFTLIELLVVISIIGFLSVAAIYSFNVVRMQGRDATRAANAHTISQALALYINDLGTYPIGDGCLSETANTPGDDLIDQDVIKEIPTDPLWPTAVPSDTTPGYAQGTSVEFCYYYSGTADNYYLSYYLESNSKSGDSGIHVITPAGAQSN